MNPYHANNTYVLDQNIPADQGFDLFIKALSEQENVAPDLLGNITILSRTEGYYPFAVKWGHFDGTFAGTPCVRYKDALIRKDRVSGPYQVSCRRVYALSDTLAKTCERIVPKDEEGERPDHLNLLVDIEHYLSENFHLFQNATHIGTAETVDDVNGKLLKRKDKRYRKSVDTICQRTAHDRVGGDEVENLEYDWRATSEGDELLYVPLLVVEYAYGGKTYVAAVPLQEDCFEPLITYPYYYKVQALENAGNQETGAVRHGGMYGFGFGIGAAIFGFLGLWTRSGGGLFPPICTAIAIVMAILGATQLVLGYINTSRAKGLAAQYLKQMAEIAALQKQATQQQTAAFFAVYHGADSIEHSRQAAAAATAFACEKEDIAYCCVDCVDKPRVKPSFIGGVQPIQEGKVLLGVAGVGLVACLLYFLIAVMPIYNLENALKHTLYQGESGGVFGDGYHLEFKDDGEDHHYEIQCRSRQTLVDKFECVVVDGDTITVDGETISVRYDDEYVTFTPSFVDGADYSVWRFEQRAKAGDRTGNWFYDDEDDGADATTTTTTQATATDAPTTTTTVEDEYADEPIAPETTDAPATTTVAEGPCAYGHSYEDGDCVNPPICSVCKAVLSEPLGHQMLGLACENCDYVDFSPVVRSYSRVTAYDATTGEEYSVTNVSISQDGVLSFTFQGKTYRLTLLPDHANSDHWMLQFDCFEGSNFIPDATLEIDTTDYMPRLTWWGLQGCNLYFYAE